jgi:hypothetical protein
MQTISDYSEKFDAMVNQYLEPSVTHKYVLPVLALILILYVAHVRPTLPNFVLELFHNNIFRLVVCTYIVYRANHDPQSAVLIAAVFLLIMHIVNKQFIEKFSSNFNSGCKKINEKLGVRDGNLVTMCNDLDNKISSDIDYATKINKNNIGKNCVQQNTNIDVIPYAGALNNFCIESSNNRTNCDTNLMTGAITKSKLLKKLNLPNNCLLK